MSITIGNVVVIDGRPRGENPYRGPMINGDMRKAALAWYKTSSDGEHWYLPKLKGQEVLAATFWCAPAEGGAYELISPTEINWETSGV